MGRVSVWWRVFSGMFGLLDYHGGNGFVKRRWIFFELCSVVLFVGMVVSNLEVCGGGGVMTSGVPAVQVSSDNFVIDASDEEGGRFA